MLARGCNDARSNLSETKGTRRDDHDVSIMAIVGYGLNIVYIYETYRSKQLIPSILRNIHDRINIPASGGSFADREDASRFIV